MVIKAIWLVKNGRSGSFQVRKRSWCPFAKGPNPRTPSEGGIRFFSLKVDREGPVVTVMLDRASEGNQVDEGMAGELREVCAQLSWDDGVLVVVFTGSGDGFSSGRTFPKHAGQDAAELRRLQAATAIAALPMPVLVALNGDATDHGLELALAGDLRLATSTARFGFSPPAPGNLPFDGGTQRLPRLVGPAWARDMLLTGRRVDVDEALAIGLVNRVVAPGEDLMNMTREVAMQIVDGSPIGARYAKEAVNAGADLALVQALGLEADLNVILQSTADRAEGIASFIERRKPEFSGE